MENEGTVATWVCEERANLSRCFLLLLGERMREFGCNMFGKEVFNHDGGMSSVRSGEKRNLFCYQSGWSFVFF